MSAASPSRPSWLIALPLPTAALEFAPPFGSLTGAANSTVPVGAKVLVPLRQAPQVGLVIGAGESHVGYRIREVLGVLQPQWVPAQTIAGVSDWAKQSGVVAGLIWADLLGTAWKAPYQHWVRATAGSDLSAFAAQHEGVALPQAQWQDAADFSPLLLDELRTQGLLDERFEPLRPVEGIIVPACAQQATPPAKPLTSKQQQALHWLQQHGEVSSLAQWSREAQVGPSVLAALMGAGHAQHIQRPAALPALPVPPAFALPATLDTPEALLQADLLPEAEQWRLHGGRAQERWRALAPRVLRLLRQGRQVLVLAPDHGTLAQAWQGLAGLAAHAQTQAVQLSGHMSEAQREHARLLIGTGQANLVLGSFLALTAPVIDLALLLVLEEASDAYKLLRGSRVFLPDLAVQIASAHGASLGLVGSVPAVESVPLLGQVLPPVRQRLHVVDYSRPPEQPQVGPLSLPMHKPQALGYPISHDLARLLRQVGERGRQAALLAPRRGYSALLQCPSCQNVPQCRNCDLPLRFHQNQHTMYCHQCGYKTAAPKQCQSCGQPLMKARGPGTEWIAQEVRRLVPQAAVWQLDKDHKDDLAPLHAGAAGIVVGTQMLLSQPAPPNLALIGVTLADTWINISDFRASERYHRLLRQLTEWHPQRAPLVVVQTFQGQHPALLSLLEQQDALAYPSSELAMRKLLHYPPYVRLARIEVSHKQAEKAHNAAQLLASALFGMGAQPDEVLGPAAGFIPRLRGEYPYQLLLRAHSPERLAQLLACVQHQVVRAKVRLDVHPRGSIWQEEGGA